MYVKKTKLRDAGDYKISISREIQKAVKVAMVMLSAMASVSDRKLKTNYFLCVSGDWHKLKSESLLVSVEVLHSSVGGPWGSWTYHCHLKTF